MQNLHVAAAVGATTEHIVGGTHCIYRVNFNVQIKEVNEKRKQKGEKITEKAAIKIAINVPYFC